MTTTACNYSATDATDTTVTATDKTTFFPSKYFCYCYDYYYRYHYRHHYKCYYQDHVPLPALPLPLCTQETPVCTSVADPLMEKLERRRRRQAEVVQNALAIDELLRHHPCSPDHRQSAVL